MGEGIDQAEKNAPRADFGGQATAATVATEETPLTKEDVAHRRNVAVMLEREWTAKQKEIEARRAAGELYERERVRDAWRSAFITLRTMIESVPDRAAPEMAAKKGDVSAIHHDMVGIMADVLREVSETFERKLGQVD